MEEENITYEEYEDNYYINNANEEKPKKNKLLIIIITLIILLLILGIFLFVKFKQKNINSTADNEIKSMYIAENEITLSIGETIMVDVIIDAERPEDIPITWFSNNNNIAVVSNGKILAVETGTTTIKAYHIDKNNKEYSVECKVIVTKNNTSSNNKPNCIFLGPNDLLINKNDTTSYALTCIDASNNFKDSTIEKSDFNYSTNDIVSINNIQKNKISNGFNYIITVSGLKNGFTNLSLKNGVISNSNGNTNEVATSNNLTVTDTNITPTPNNDITKPGCTFSGPTNSSITIGTTTSYTLTCIDASNNFKDSVIEEEDLIYSSIGIISIKLSKTTITNGFKYTITTTGIKAGSTTLSLKAGVISDASGNTNNEITSNPITITSATSNNDKTKPICTFDGPSSPSIKIGGTASYSLTCTDVSNNFKDSIIEKKDFNYSTNGIVSINLSKTTISNGFKYTITTTGAKAGGTTLSLKAGVISDASGNTNNTVTSGKITVVANDTTKPNCTFAGPDISSIKIGTSATYTLTCTDASNKFKDSTIDKTDFTYNNNGIISINLSKTTISNGFKYTITTTGIKAGITTLSLKTGVISDASGNTNNTVTSNKITVVENDTTKPNCVLSAPAKAAIPINSTTTYTITCTDASNIFKDSTIEKTDFTFNNNGIISITNISKSNVSNGFKYVITVKGLKTGSANISIKSGVITDGAGNTNNTITSSSIKIQTCKWVQTSHTQTNSCTAVAKPSNPTNGSTYITCANTPNNNNYTAKYFKGIYTYTCS